MHRPIIFDFDGVIVDSELLGNRALAECLTQLGHPTTTEESIARYMGFRMRDCIHAIERHHNCTLPADFPDRWGAQFDLHRAQLQPVAGAVAFIRSSLPERTAIASSSRRHEISLSLQTMGLADHFANRIFSAADLERGKPHPDVFLHAATGLSANPTDCIVIEDGTLGVQGAVAAGMTVIGLTAGSHCGPAHAERLREAGAHIVAGSYTEVALLIGEFSA